MDPDAGCALNDANFASGYEHTQKTAVASKKTDTQLFEAVLKVITSVDKMMAWGASYSFWTQVFPDVVLNDSVHSHGSYHGEYYEPYLADKWRSDRATIMFAGSSRRDL